jgi:hypothetical protein
VKLTDSENRTKNLPVITELFAFNSQKKKRRVTSIHFTIRMGKKLKFTAFLLKFR